MVSNSVRFSRVVLSQGKLESIWLELFPSSKKRSLLLCCVYRPPSSSGVFFDDLEAECDYVLSNRKSSKLVILGDLNCDLGNHKLPQTKLLLGLCSQLHLSDVVKLPTRVTPSTSTRLDVILSNIPDHFSGVVTLPFSGSDHLLVVAEFYPRGISAKRAPEFVSYCNYNKIDSNVLEKVCSVLNDDVWKSVQELDDVEASSFCLNQIMKGTMDLLLPIKRRRVKLNPPMWNLSPQAKSARYARDEAHRLALKTNTPEAWSVYKKLRNRATSILRLCKARYIAELASDKRQSKTFWKCFSHLSGQPTSMGESPANLSSHSADDFNLHFLSVATNLVSELEPSPLSPLTYMDGPSDMSFDQFAEVNCDEVLQHLKSLDHRKATGPDEISARFLKVFSCVFVPPITAVINLCLSKPGIPLCWKKANVFPLQKSSTSKSLDNFRPISVLPVLSKVLERVVYSQVMDYLDHQRILSPVQSGFRPGYSTQDVLVYVTDEWRKAVDNRYYVGSVFLDLRKAFDCVDHRILLLKLAKYGIRYGVLRWFECYLQNRFQRVCINGNVSGWRSLPSVGVPQGSVLGPLLFMLYINDLPRVVSGASIFLYADDTLVYAASPSIGSLQSILQRVLNEIAKWMISNRISLNVSKSVSMLIGVPQKIKGLSLNLSIGSAQLSSVRSCKYLGVIIDDHLSWREHIRMLANQMGRQFFCILRLLPLSPAVVARVYHAFVLSRIDYCDVVWGSAVRSSLAPLDRIHRRVCGLLRGNTSVTMSLGDRRNFHMATLAFKVLKGLSPSYLHGLLSFSREITHRSNRNSHRVFVTSVRTEFAKRCFYFRAVNVSYRNFRLFKSLFCLVYCSFYVEICTVLFILTSLAYCFSFVFWGITAKLADVIFSPLKKKKKKKETIQKSKSLRTKLNMAEP